MSALGPLRRPQRALLKLYSSDMVVSASSIRDMSTDEKLPRADSDGSLASIDDATNHAEYKVRRSRLIGMVNWWHVAMTFYPRGTSCLKNKPGEFPALPALYL